MNKQQKIFYIIIGCGLLLCVISILSIMFSRRSTTPSSAPIPTPYQAERIEPPVQYEPGSLDKAVEKMKNPEQLQGNDQTIKIRFLQQLNNKSGELITASTFRITYVEAFNLFEAEILTTDIIQAKQDAVSWLKMQGLSDQGICNLPLTFFLNFEVSNKLRNQQITFNPLPEGC